MQTWSILQTKIRLNELNYTAQNENTLHRVKYTTQIDYQLHYTDNMCIRILICSAKLSNYAVSITLIAIQF